MRLQQLVGTRGTPQGGEGVVAFHPSDKSPIWSPFSFNTPSAPGYNSGDVGRSREVKSAGERETAYKATDAQSRDNKGHLAACPLILQYVTSSASSSCCSGSCDGHARPLLLLLLLVLLINWFLWLRPPPRSFPQASKAAARVLDTIYGYKKTANGVLKGMPVGRGAVIGLKWSAVSAVCANSQNPRIRRSLW